MAIAKHEIDVMTAEDKLKKAGEILSKAQTRFRQTGKWYQYGLSFLDSLLDNPKAGLQHLQAREAEIEKKRRRKANDINRDN